VVTGEWCVWFYLGFTCHRLIGHVAEVGVVDPGVEIHRKERGSACEEKQA
jgi:hypothetical protein